MIAGEELNNNGENQPQTQISSNTTYQKPQFFSKAEREKLRIQREAEEKEEQRRKEKQIQSIRKEYNQFSSKDQRRRTEEPAKKSRSRSRERENSRYITSNTRATIPIKLKGQDNELMSIKMQYLGLNKEKKKILKPSEKFKNIFNFEWDAIEDTSIDYNPLYQNRMEANLLFGRGYKAGFDVSEQRQRAVQYDRLITKYDENVESATQQKQMDEELVKQTPKMSDEYAIASRTEEELKLQKKDIYDITVSDHWSKKRTSEMTERDWRIFREDNDILIKGGKVINPMRDWVEAPLPPIILDAVRRLQYKKPTPIQMQTIPIGLERKDLIGIAPTGSGKSAAFLIPLISYLLTLPPQDDMICKDGPYALILAPARELAIQIDEEFSRLSIGTKLRSFVVVGGRREEEQAFHLKKGIEVLIGTPGRIKDALQKKFLVFDQCTWTILDEADKMIDLGFENDVNMILDSITTVLKSNDEATAEIQEKLSKLGEKQFRVTHLFSATMPPQVEKLAKKYLRAFCFISIGEPGGGKKDIEQKIELLTEASKKHKLLQLLDQAEPPIIIFANQKKSVELLAKILEKNGRNAVIYHGGKTQQQREAAVDGFKSRKYDILIATDLAGRGLHVEGVKMVINFDAPKNIQDFIHRTGRTGRAGKKGLAVTFLTNADEELFYDLKEFLIKNNQTVPAQLDEHPATRTKPGQIPDNVPRRKQVIFAH